MEKLELYDENNKPTGKSVLRGDKNIEEGLRIKLVTVWFQKGNNFLLQKSSQEKGGEIAVTGGHVPYGETSLSQAVIEVEEELGVSVLDKDLVYVGNIILPKVIFDVYKCEKELPSNLKLQKEEVAETMWATKEEIQKWINGGVLRKSTQLQYETFFKNK